MSLPSRTRLIAAAAGAGAVALAVAMTGNATAAAAPAASPAVSAGPTLDHAFVIMLENHSRQGVIGDRNAPYLTSLAHRYGQATNYYGVTHPSEPNYIALLSGSNWGVNNDSADNRFDHTNLVDTLEAHGMTWRGYLEAMPATGSLVDSWPSDDNALYASKHNPFVLFADIRHSADRLRKVRPYDRMATDLNRPSAPNFVFIAPDQCNDMHGGVYTAIPGRPETPCPYGSTNDDANDSALKAKADTFVKKAVTTIMSSKAWTRHSAIFIIADEGDYTGKESTGGWESPAGCCDSPYVPAGAPDISPNWPGGIYGGAKVPAIVIAASGPRHFTSSRAYNHYSLLRTLEDAWHLEEIGATSDHRQVHPMNEFLD